MLQRVERRSSLVADLATGTVANNHVGADQRNAAEGRDAVAALADAVVLGDVALAGAAVAETTAVSSGGAENTAVGGRRHGALVDEGAVQVVDALAVEGRGNVVAGTLGVGGGGKTNGEGGRGGGSDRGRGGHVRGGLDGFRSGGSEF